MAATMESTDVDDMDSLFEGMVLFNPSDQLIPTTTPAATHNQHEDVRNTHQEVTASTSTSTATTDANPSSSFPTHHQRIVTENPNQPLDENLFSDLTLLASSHVLLEEEVADSGKPADSVSAIQSVSRQSSYTSTRKKKRSKSLRIGYGRGGGGDRDNPSVDPVTTTTNTTSNYFSSTDAQLQGSPSPLLPVHVNSNSNKNDRDHHSPEERDDGEHAAHEQGKFGLANINQGQVTANSIRDSTSGSAIEARFNEIKTLVSDKLKNARDAVAFVSAARKESIRRRRQAADNVNQASSMYRELEKELDEACEAEDFERAERVSENIASVDKDRELLRTALRDAEDYCDSHDSKMQRALQLQIEAEEESASKLRNFALDATRTADLVVKNAQLRSSKQMEDWLSLTEVIDVKKLELEIESLIINQARLVFNDSIGHLVIDDQRERDLLCKRKEILTEELMRLIALVKEKEAEIAETESSIQQVEKRIAGVVSSFQEVQSTIDTNYYRLQSSLSEMEMENESLSKRKKEIDNLLHEEEARAENIRELSRISADEANVYLEAIGMRKNLLLFTLKSREDKERLSKTEEGLFEYLQMLKQEISAARALLQELSSTKTSIQQEVESSQQRLVFIDKRVPELEAEKRVAATARNFKEAARIASESKSLLVEKEGIQIKLDTGLFDLKKLEEEICATIERIQMTEEQIASKEKEWSVARFQRLSLIAAIATAERSAALELGDLEEANSLLAEAEAASTEARKLKSVHHLSEDESESIAKHYVSMELVSKLGGKQLAELVEQNHTLTS